MEQFFAQLEGPILLWIQEYIRNDLLKAHWLSDDVFAVVKHTS